MARMPTSRLKRPKPRRAATWAPVNTLAPKESVSCALRRPTRTSSTSALVAIVGGSGSGKTWLADKLEHALKPNVTRLSLDDFYRDRSHLPVARRAQVNFDHPRAIDWPRLQTALESLLENRAALAPRYDFKTHSRMPTGRKIKPKPIILLEGLWVLHRARIRRLLTLSVFLDCPVRTRLQRRLARDMASRGRSKASIRRQFMKCVQPMHDRYVAPQRRFADLIFRHQWGASEIRLLCRSVKELGIIP